MGEWKECKLGDAITLQRGHDLPRRKMIEGNIPVAGSNGIIGYHNQSTTKAPGITIGRSGNLGNAFLYKDDFWAHNTTLYVKDFKGNYEIFIYYFLKSFDFKQFNVGSAVPTLNRNHIHPLDILLPPLPEQKAIASILSSLDDKIDLLHRQNKTLEAMAETLFRQWFVAEADEDWEDGSLLEVIQLVGGGTPKTSIVEYWDGDIPWLAGGDITSNHKSFVKYAEKNITEAALNNSATKLLPKYATIISARGTVGKYCLLAQPMAFSQSNYGILPKNSDCYFFTYLLINHVVEELQASAYGSVFDTITTTTFKENKVQLPPETEILQFDNSVSVYFEKMFLNKSQIQTLEKLRDTLLPKLMSGEVRVEHDAN
jgi:type I restriction enzyme S subunit